MDIEDLHDRYQAMLRKRGITTADVVAGLALWFVMLSGIAVMWLER
jgi:hypothetical protein